MADDLPIDWNNPRVREYLSLTRLQVLTPLSLLINIFTICICAFVVSPSLSQVEKLFPTAISPRPIFIAIYVAAIWATQLGYCVLLLIARKQETKQTLIKGVGYPLVFANWIFAGWAIAWIFKQFMASTILQGILLILLLYSNVNLLIYHKPTFSRPLDIAMIHTPVRFFFILPFQLLFWLSLFVTLDLTYDPDSSSGPPRDYHRYPWSGFGVIFGANLISLLVVVVRGDVVWAVASAWLSASIWARKYVPGQVEAVAILFTFLHPIALIATYIYRWFFTRRKEKQGQVALEGDDHPGLHGSHERPDYNGERENRGPREVDAGAVWG